MLQIGMRNVQLAVGWGGRGGITFKRGDNLINSSRQFSQRRLWRCVCVFFFWGGVLVDACVVWDVVVKRIC